MSNKAMIAMSGGVDSSVAAWLTKQAGAPLVIFNTGVMAGGQMAEAHMLRFFQQPAKF